MNATLVNGLELMMFLARHPQPQRISELAEKLDLPRSHVHRLLQTLVEGQYVVKDAQRRYMIGVGALRLGHALLKNLPIRRKALPLMQQAVGQIGQPLTLTVPFGSEAISVAHIAVGGQIRPDSETLGTVLAPHASASGKLFLAFKPESEREAALAAIHYPQRGKNTHLNSDSLRADLEEIAVRDYSVNDREGGRDSYSIAVPIRDEFGQVEACLGASGVASLLKKTKRTAIRKSLQILVENIESQTLEHVT